VNECWKVMQGKTIHASGEYRQERFWLLMLHKQQRQHGHKSARKRVEA
jgi:hypothetical protein